LKENKDKKVEPKKTDKKQTSNKTEVPGWNN